MPLAVPPPFLFIMPLPLSQETFGPSDFIAEFFGGFNFKAEFDFGDFGLDFAYPLVRETYTFDDYYDGEDVSMDFSVDGTPGQRSRRRWERCKNCMYRIESIKSSCWYCKFLAPSEVRDMTYSLSMLDRYGKFCTWFCMPLEYVERLTELMIVHGYIQEPRSLWHCAKLNEREELLVMLALIILGNGGNFRKCCTVTHIPTSKVRKFFFNFLGAMYDKWDEHIKLLENVAELNSITRYYKFFGFLGCVGSMDVLHIKWNNCLTGDHNRAKGKEGYLSLGFQCITDYNHCILGIFGPMFGEGNDKEIVKLVPNVKKIHCGWFSHIWCQYNLESG
jgi:hypothetical protein